MKKRLFAIILCISILCSLPSCVSKSAKLEKLEGAERADAFFDIVNADPADAYVTEMKMEISGSLYGMPLEAKAENETTYINFDGNDPVYHSEGHSEITVGSDSAKTSQTTKTVSGYRDGKLYEKIDKDGKASALVSSVSSADFKAHTERLVGYSDEELEALHKSATVKECVKNEDGTWEASFSGYSEESVAALIDYAFDPTVLLLDGYKVKDIRFKVETNEDFLPTDWEYKIIFEKTDDSELYPEAEAKTEIEFNDIGTAQAPELDLSAYTEVEGLIELQKIRADLGKAMTSDSGSFTAENKQNVNSGAAMNSTCEIDKVVYMTDNGKYEFEVDAKLTTLADTKGTEYDISYINGSFIISQRNSSNTQRQDMTESNARAFIYRLIDPAGLSDALVSGIKTNFGEYTHIFTLADPDYSALEASLSPLGATDFSADASVGVIYKNDVLEKYYYCMTLTCTANGLKVTVKAESTVTFDTSATVG